MSWRMIDFECSECKHRFEDIADCVDGITKQLLPCPKCKHNSKMIMETNTRVHRKGNRYRDVSWSTWSIS